MVNVQTLHRRASRVLPEVVKTSGVVLDNAEEGNIAGMLFPLRRKSAGSVVFRMSNEMIEAMGQHPLDYLQHATKARHCVGGQRNPFSYRAWRSVVVPASTTPLQVLFTSATNGKAWVLIIPEEKWVVYAWND